MSPLLSVVDEMDGSIETPLLVVLCWCQRFEIVAHDSEAAYSTTVTSPKIFKKTSPKLNLLHRSEYEDNTPKFNSTRSS